MLDGEPRWTHSFLSLLLVRREDVVRTSVVSSLILAAHLVRLTARDGKDALMSLI